MSTASTPRPLNGTMKTATLLAVLAAALAPVAPARAAGIPHATAHEIHLVADLDGDGRGDLVIVDRATGVFRSAYQTAPGVFAWAGARPTGVTQVTGVGAGRLTTLSEDQLAVASPDANRINLVAVPSPDSSAPAIDAHPVGMLPRELAVLEIGGAGGTAHEDLFVSTRGAFPPNAERLELLRNKGGIVTPLDAQNAGADLIHLRSARLRTPGPQLAAGTLRNPAADTLRVWDLAAGTLAAVTSLSLPPGSADGHAFGQFTAGENHHVLLWAGGSPLLRIAPVTGTSPAPPALGPATTHDLGFPIASVQVLDTTPARFLVTGNGGSRVRAYAYDGVGTPTQLAEWVPPAGQEFSGVLASADGSFHLLRQPAGGTSSTGWDRFVPKGAGFLAGGSGVLPALNRFGTAANLFLFAREPFVSPQPGLIGTLNAADWSSGLNLGGATVKVNAERLGTSAQGLDDPTPRDLGTKPAGTAFGLVNQYREPISIASFQPAVGVQASEVHIQPPEGPQRQAIVVRLATTDPTHLVSYRVAGGPWATAVSSASFPLYQNGTVDFFARPPAGNTKSPLRHATYTFPDPPATQDSDGDGVPDFVEVARGLDPNGGPDSDGDGYTDYTELLGGPPQYDPLSTNRPAGDLPRFEERSSFHLAASPRPLDGVTGGETAPAVGQAVQLHDLPGGLLGQGPTVVTVPGALFLPAALLADAPANTTLGMLAVSTEPHLAIATAAADKMTGREVLALLPVPEVVRPAVSFAPGPGPLAGQADAWIAAAKAAAASVPVPRINLRVGVPETLTALVLERKLHDILVGRGFDGLNASNRLTLFPSRPGDVLRHPLTAEAVEALPERGPGNGPAWSLPSLHQTISNALPADLLELATEVYRISSLSNNAAPGRYPLPVDTLRQFLEEGTLHSNYAAVVSLSPAQVTAAQAAAAGLLAGLSPRPTNFFDLEVALDTFQPGCTRLYQVGTGTPFNLFQAPSVPFKFPQSFALIPGSRVRVLAFTDFTDPCPGTDLQVLEATLIAIPAPSLTDLDGDLLPDDWECLFLAGNGDPDGDLDGDGGSNLQEYLDGTDPGDALFVPPVIVDLSPPVIVINLLPGETKELHWQFPAAYANRFRFSLFQADEFGDGFQPTGIQAQAGPGGSFSLLLPAVQKARGFYVVVQQLR